MMVYPRHRSLHLAEQIDKELERPQTDQANLKVHVDGFARFEQAVPELALQGDGKPSPLPPGSTIGIAEHITTGEGRHFKDEGGQGVLQSCFRRWRRS